MASEPRCIALDTNIESYKEYRRWHRPGGTHGPLIFYKVHGVGKNRSHDRITDLGSPLGWWGNEGRMARERHELQPLAKGRTFTVLEGEGKGEGLGAAALGTAATTRNPQRHPKTSPLLLGIAYNVSGLPNPQHGRGGCASKRRDRARVGRKERSDWSRQPGVI